MQSVLKLLQQAKSKSLDDLRSSQKQSLSKFREIADGISQSYKVGNFSSFSIIDLDSSCQFT